MIFYDRKDAGAKLAEALIEFKGKDAVVFALPRGGVIPGAEIAKRLNIPLELIITKKVGHPLNPEYAVCAVSECADPICNEEEVGKIDKIWLEKEIVRVRDEIKRRKEEYQPQNHQIQIRNKIAIIVDDGIATGLTMFAAIDEIRKQEPKAIVVAVPVSPYETFEKLKKMCEHVVVLNPDKYFFGGVGAYYEEFQQVSDGQVIDLLKELKK